MYNVIYVCLEVYKYRDYYDILTIRVCCSIPLIHIQKAILENKKFSYLKICTFLMRGGVEDSDP